MFLTIDFYQLHIPVSYTHLDVYKRQGLFLDVEEVGEIGAAGDVQLAAVELIGLVIIGRGKGMRAVRGARLVIEEAGTNQGDGRERLVDLGSRGLVAFALTPLLAIFDAEFQLDIGKDRPPQIKSGRKIVVARAEHDAARLGRHIGGGVGDIDRAVDREIAIVIARFIGCLLYTSRCV